MWGGSIAGSSREFVNTCLVDDSLTWLVYSMALVEGFSHYILEMLPIMLKIFQVFQDVNSIKGKMLWYESQLLIKSKIKISCYKEVYFTCNSAAVARNVKELPLIISISGDQFKEKENIPEELIINCESNLYMLVLVTMFLKSLDNFISVF